MPPDPIQAGQMVLQAGAAGVLLVGIFAIVTGKLRTSQEIQAWQKRAERAEAQVDTLLPLVNKVADELLPMGSALETIADRQNERVVPALERLEREIARGKRD